MRRELADFLAQGLWMEWYGPLANGPTTHDEQVLSLLYMLERFEKSHGLLFSLTEEHPVIKQLNRMEEMLMATNTGLSRLQASADSLKAQMLAMKEAFAAAVRAQTDANTRLENDIASLRNIAGSGDTAALNTIADSLDATLTDLKATTDNLNAVATAEAAVDVAPPPVVVPTLVISPVSTTVPRTGSQSFSTTGGTAPVTFKATNGTIDASGNYVPPADVTFTSDVVVATSADGQNASANVSIADLATGGTSIPATQGIKP